MLAMRKHVTSQGSKSGLYELRADSRQQEGKSKNKSSQSYKDNPQPPELNIVTDFEFLSWVNAFVWDPKQRTKIGHTQ